MTDYPPNMTLRPLVTWPNAETRDRRRAPFSSGWSSTVGILMTELRQLGTNPRGPSWSQSSFPPSVLQLALREQDFRKDGMPNARAVPSHPGVIVNIESKHGPLSYPCDAFDRWQDNLRAIALGLEALRKVSRYGISPGTSSTPGWKQLGSSSASTAPMTIDQATQFLREMAGAPEGQGLDLETMTQLHRRARAVAHPDRHGGDHTMAYQVDAAAEVLRNAGKL